MSFCKIVGHKDAKLALILNLIDPGVGGVLLVGDKGTGKSSLARAVVQLLPDGMPYVEVPLNITEDALMGSVSIEDAIRTGEHAYQAGLLARAQGGVLYVDDVNLLNPDMLNLVLNNHAFGSTTSEGNVSESRSDYRFSLVASMNPEEGPISPKVLDHFGLCALFPTPADQEQRLRVLKRSSNSDRLTASLRWIGYETEEKDRRSKRLTERH